MFKHMFFPYVTEEELLKGVFFTAFLFMETVVMELCIPLQLHQSTRRHETLQICFLNSCKIACNMSIIQRVVFFS